MVESFSIKEEKFIDETYYMKLGVSFTRKKVFDYMKKKNIFPSIPAKKKVLFVPVMIDEDKKDLLLFSNNKFFDESGHEIKDKKEINKLDISTTLASEIEQILSPCEKNLYEDITSSPHVLFLAGVNGSGKTTTAGKIAEQFRLQNKSVILAASDTFRAAAVEQLKTWGNRVGAEVVFGADGGDSAAVGSDTVTAGSVGSAIYTFTSLFWYLFG